MVAWDETDKICSGMVPLMAQSYRNEKEALKWKLMPFTSLGKRKNILHIPVHFAAGSKMHFASQTKRVQSK
jgi:hypothetical protein